MCLEVERIGLGCDRLGSVNGVRGQEAEELIEAALEQGIRLFDTAPVYGQGESERLLGRRLGRVRGSVTIVTKVGQYLPFHLRALVPLKRVIRSIARRSEVMRTAVAVARQGLLPQKFSEAFIQREVQHSLQRLQTEYLDILLLHSPSAAVLHDGGALDKIGALQQAGIARRVGVAFESAAAALTSVEDDRIQAMEFPLDCEVTTAALLQRAKERGIFTIVRGMARFSQSAGISRVGDDRSAALARAAIKALSTRGVSCVIIGTTSQQHLQQFMSAARSASAHHSVGS